MRIETQSVTKRFGTYMALNHVTLAVEEGELVALLGPSGSGKTTLLRVIAGLEHPDSGAVLFDGIDASAQKTQSRKVGFVFQHYALFKHMTVFENIAFGLRVRRRTDRPAEAVIQRRVGDLLNLVQLSAFRDRFPSQLSGGQRQRVALARALAVEPRVLLLDEPFGALDARVRQELRQWLRRLHDQLHVTSVFVTHDQEEALELADRVVIMDQGHIEQEGTPEEVYRSPRTAFVYRFLGDVNLFRGRVCDGAFRIGSSPRNGAPHDWSSDDDCALYVRPHQLSVGKGSKSDVGFEARVLRVNTAGPLVKVQLLAPWGDTLRAELTHDKYAAEPLVPDAMVRVSVDQQAGFVVPRSA